jgi:hypothetical protein
MRVSDVFLLSDGRVVFVGPVESAPRYIGTAACDVIVDGEVTGQIEVSQELPERRVPSLSNDLVLSTYGDAGVTADTAQNRDVRLREC